MKNMKTLISTFFIGMLILPVSSCGVENPKEKINESESGISERAMDNNNQKASSGNNNSTSLTEKYLFGEWCHASTDRVDDADEIEDGKNIEMNLNWEFKKRGAFLRQKSQRNKTMGHSRNWNIENGLLNIDIYLLGAQKVEILSRDQFIFHFQSMRLNIYRGKCK